MIELNSYFEPLSDLIYSDKDKWETTQIGRLIDSYTIDHFPDLKFAEIAIFNIAEYEGSENNVEVKDCKIRSEFYQLHQEKIGRIVDLGFLKMMPTRKESFKVIQNVCKELLYNGIIPIVIGGGHDLGYAVYKAYVELEKYITFTSVDKSFDIGLENDRLASYSHFGKMISHKPNHLFHYVNLGFQTYFVSPIALDMLSSMNFDFIRLGDLRTDLKEVEPVMRNTDFLSFDISAIKSSSAQANAYSSPNGLDGEDACKIMHYAGLSDKLTAVGLFEYNPELDIRNQTAQLLAQMIWYFISGYQNRKHELNPNLKNCVKYTVPFEDGKNKIVFYKSKTSGRWWIRVPFKKEGVKKPQNYFVACSYRDYQIALHGEIPQRWLKTYNKFI